MGSYLYILIGVIIIVIVAVLVAHFVLRKRKEVPEAEPTSVQKVPAVTAPAVAPSEEVPAEEPTTLKFCNKCGAERKPGAKFCRKCGNTF